MPLHLHVVSGSVEVLKRVVSLNDNQFIPYGQGSSNCVRPRCVKLDSKRWSS